MSIQNIMAIAIISFGFVLMATAAVGVIRFPDFFTRIIMITTIRDILE